MRLPLLTLLMTGAMAVGPATSYGQTGDSAQQQAAGNARQQAVAQQCLDDLAQFSQRLEEEQFWVTGLGGRWGFGVGAPAMGSVPGVAADGAVVEGRAAVDGVEARPDAMVGSPWGPAGIAQVGFLSPRNQIRQLFGAAQVLAYQGEEEGCQYVLGELTQTYGQFAERLAEAGIDPSDVTSWRREQIALAKPISEVQGISRLTVDDVTGVDVRNLEDDNLGSVTDVVLDPESGQISYAIVARGGFLGIGDDEIAVPWDRFRVAPGLNALVLDVSVDELEAAPEIDPDRFADLGTLAQQNDEIDQYWSQRGS